ncbi:ATP-binding protein [Ensifer sp. ENS12]|uniref:ATP-binding protein n=1 Tax=Ensifer sp. ENS12 TaxID=2854774 RepID=UPI0013B0235B|nr:ATP-binding protein [Ensifer sp. ENS12]MBV7521930.1 hypothetical protein [Ensifer sp. ENS12]
MVPSNQRPQESASRFFYGHAPEWSDFESGFDVSRSITSSIINDVENLLNNTVEESRIIILTDEPGTGKTTVVRRVAFEISRRGIHTLVCSALSRLEYDKTLSIVDGIEGPLLIVVDNFADQVSPFAEIVSKTRKKDLVVLASERGYRNRYLFQSLSGVPYHRAAALKMRAVDVEAIVERYTELGIVGTSRAIRDLNGFIKSAADDPMAVVCCRVLNDFRPLDRIAFDLMEECNEVDQNRYLIAALSQHCFGGGVRHEILSSILGSQGYREQLSKEHALPLSYYDRRTNTHVVPQNSTIAMRILDNMSKRDPRRLLDIFTRLASTLAPRVNRKAIKQRSSEARLASRLFDFDSVVDGILGDLAPAFYEATQKAWQWNSRYWEQVALMNVSRHNSSGVRGMTEYLDSAVQNARHAASIENHPLPLTTLSKILFIQVVVPGYSRVGAFNEAFDCSDRAIKIEKSWARKSVHPYVTMFRGAREYLERGGVMSSTQMQRVRDLLLEAEKLFPKDHEVGDNLRNLRALI